VGSIIFEFGTFAKRDFALPEDFVDRLDTFLSELPTGWRYGVEIRSADYLCPAYFATRASYGVAHVFNAWTRMPELSDQTSIEDAFTAESPGVPLREQPS